MKRTNQNHPPAYLGNYFQPLKTEDMISDPFQLLLLFLVLFKVVSSSSSDDDEFKVRGHSSDDEDSVNHHGDTGLEDAFEDINLNHESASSYQKDFDSQFRVKNSNGAKPLSCLDGNGNEVDWWFVYKEPDGKRYLYLSSLDVEDSSSSGEAAKFLPLKSQFLIDDPYTSPIIKTIYHPKNRTDTSEVWMGWNDQPTDSLDGYGTRVCGVKHAHSKGFYAQNAVFTNIQPHEVVIGSYAILTSLPQFPQIAQGPYVFGGAIKNELPNQPSQIFGSNLSANAQHFMCLSFPREKARLETAEAGIVEVPVKDHVFSQSVHRNFLKRYLKTIHPAIVGTNFSDSNASHWLWRRYFSLLKYPYKAANHLLTDPRLNQKLMAYSTADLPSFYYDTHATHVFPLSTSQFHHAKNGNIEYNSSLSSRWDVRFAHQNGCTDGTQRTCLQSFTFQTTSLQSPLNGNFFAKHAMSVLDLYDDWAALQVAEAQRNFENYYAGQTVDRYGLLVQSWIDSKTILPMKPDKKIYDSDGKLIAKVHIDNVAHFHMPQYRLGSRRIDTSHKDHSKWAISFALDTFNTDGKLEDDDASFCPLVFVADLNRATTQARLKDKNQGRGGGIVAISSFSLWHALMDLSPRSYRQRFVTNGKHRTRQLQNRLRSYTSGSFSGMNQLPVVPLRKFTFKALRLSRKEARKPVKPVKFVSVLNEISQFIKMAEFQSEHSAIAAFQRLFRNISAGKVIDAARRAWDRTRQQLESNSEDGIICIANWPKLFAIPSLELYREIPESREDDEYLRGADLEQQTEQLIIDPKTAVVTTGDIFNVINTKIQRLPRTKETQTQTEDIEESEDDSDAEHTEDDSDNNSEDESEKEYNSDYEHSEYSNHSNYSYFDSDHSNEYADHMNRIHRENDGDDYDYGSDGGYESY